MPKDACYRSVKARYAKFPSARASQAIAKCRKKKGQSRKSSEGASLKRWASEKWKEKSGKPCGTTGSYCRPSKRVSSKTPKTRSQLSKSQESRAESAKRQGRRAPTYRKSK
jgi:hypothetical protein